MVARHETRKPPLRLRRDEVVPRPHSELKKPCGHDGTDGMHAGIIGPCPAAAVTKKTGERLAGAGEKRLSKDIAIGRPWLGLAIECDHGSRREAASVGRAANAAVLLS